MYNIVDLIIKKRDGVELSEAEWYYFVEGAVNNTIPDYQITPLLMAIYLKGITKDELFNFTNAIVKNGEIMDFSYLESPNCDKHSTGGVGDKVSLILLPIMGSLGIKMPKMSGRGLSFSGGTIDKLESIPGLKVALNDEDFKEEIDKIGIGIISQTKNIAPGDKIFYGLRDVTGTVDNVNLIASSIVSKKVASGCSNIVYDVKVGSGAFMKNIKEAKVLGRLLVDLTSKFGRKSISIITPMEEPLGYKIGNALEIEEVLEELSGKGISDLMRVVITLGSGILKITGKTKSIAAGKKIILNELLSKRPLYKFKDMIEFQGGNINSLPKSKYSYKVLSKKDGYISRIDALAVGNASVNLGAGRIRVEDKIDYTAGIELLKKSPMEVKKGEVILILHYTDENLDIEKIEKKILLGIKIEEKILKKSNYSIKIIE